MERVKKYLEKTPESSQSAATIAFLASLDAVEKDNPLIAKAIEQELKDQRKYLKLIASENFSSPATQLAMGNLLTDKYSEGYVGHRFYAGCENVDRIEKEASDLAKALFGAEHAYVQPHSGADANLVAFWAILTQRVQTPEVEKLGKKNLDELSSEEFERVRRLLTEQKMMGLALSSGGHLTHGFRQNISAKMMRAFSYEVDPKTHLLDYAAIARQAKEVKPLILIAGYSAYPRLIDFAKMKEIADSVGAVLMVDMAHFAGLVAGKVLEGPYNPIPFADIVTSTTHKILRGPRGGIVLCKEEFASTVDRGCPLVLGGPLPHVMAAKAVSFKEALTPAYQSYARQVVKNAQALAESLKAQGVRLVTGGTDNHLVVCDVAQSFQITGRQAETLLREAYLTVNRNSVPQDANGAWYTSGIRLGTPAMTSLGMKEAEMKEIGAMIADLLSKATPSPDPKTGGASRAKATVPEEVLRSCRERAVALLQNYPLYPEIPDLC